MKISVIVPCYNAADTLASCLKSLVAQDADLEIIIQDGGSTDHTERVISPFISHINHYSSQPDNGVYDAMNKGIDKASGDWLYFLGADDVLASSTSLSMLVADVPSECDVAIGKTHNLPPRHPKVPEWYPAQWNRQLRLKNIVHHQGIVYRNSIFTNYRYPEQFRILADYHLNLSLFYAGVKADLKNVHVANCASDGISKNFDPSLYREEWKVKKDMLPKKELWYQPAVLATKYVRKRIS